VATRSLNPDELRNRFRAAQRMPQFLEVKDMVRLALRQLHQQQLARAYNSIILACPTFSPLMRVM